MNLSFERIELVPKYVFRTARTTSASSESVIVRLSDGEIEGLGEADPSRFYGETADSVVDFLERIRPQVEHAAHESELMAELTSRGGKGDPAARAALEIAAHDMMGKRHGKPLYRFLGLHPSDAPATMMSIGLDDPEVMLRKAMEASGFPMLKIKLDANIDLSVVRVIKEVTGSTIAVDANCSWSPAGAIERIKELQTIGVEFVEQPVAADNIKGLKLIKKHTSIPIFADESCPTSAEIPLVAKAVDGIVIKLMKCGGIVEAVKMANMARKRRLKTMIGCMIESSLAITAAAHIAPLMDYADLDSGLLLKDDPFVGVDIDCGKMTLPKEPGLGVHPASP